MTLTTSFAPAATQSLPDLLGAQVAKHPDRLAVVDGDHGLSYRELAARSAALADCLRRFGVTFDECVGLFVEPSAELMVGAWGILTAGAAYLPLAPEYPEDRLRYMIEDARVRLVFCQESLADRLESLVPPGTGIITLRDVDRPGRAGDWTRAGAVVPPHGDHLAYVIYTSGSTGRPKGVMIEHRSIVSQMRWLRAEHGLDATKIVLQKTPMSFDAAQWEILAPACGSTVVMGRPGIHRDPEQLIRTIAEHRVTTLQCVPTLLQALLDDEDFARCASLTQIFSGGEVLTRALATQCLETLPGCELVNLYGPTECTINSSAHRVDRAALAAGPPAVPIGTPVPGTGFHILDRDLLPVAGREVGELYISGVQVARGYLHRPDLTADRFVDHPFPTDPGHRRLYRTGDLASWNTDGTVQFAGRADNQVKLRGFRIELDEIRLGIERHEWVKTAAVVVKDDPRTGARNLVAFVELDPRRAALMDQGEHGAHHQSKESRLQVRAQLAALGRRTFPDGDDAPEAVVLPGQTPTARQRRTVFARKTYRYYEGGPVSAADILAVLDRRPTGSGPRDVSDLSLAELGEILRYFGEYLSPERLLPKYGYASPGSLYAAQMYLEIRDVAGVAPGRYYYHPGLHRLILVDAAATAAPGIRVHFVGHRRAIEPVYKLNIREVLEIEAGHMIGLFEEILPGYGLDIAPLEYAPVAQTRLGCPADDHYLGTFELVPFTGPRPDDGADVYVQGRPGAAADLAPGLHHHRDGRLVPVSEEVIGKHDVIAINQAVYERAGLGVAVVSRNPRPWLRYIDLGRILQRLQMNDRGLGFMSAGYSSKSGHPLPAARRLDAILRENGRDTGPCYFFVGGAVSERQIRSEGMDEDVVHMKGPAELVRDSLADFLPDYMLPAKVVILDRMPVLANGKTDVLALARRADVPARPFVAPRSEPEQRLGRLWGTALKCEAVSVHDDFFECGGNSLVAVSLLNRINKEFGVRLPVQALFEAPTVEKLALAVAAARASQNTDGSGAEASRLVRLSGAGGREPVFCWPGLGGYAMNLRLLACEAGLDRPFYGVQAYGINEGEDPYPDLAAMAAEDVRQIRRVQPSGPYTLWGYSFGARVAFEAAYQLEQSGEKVENLYLIAPGSPRVPVPDRGRYASDPVYRDSAFVAVLFTVFSGAMAPQAVADCLAAVHDEASFVAFIDERYPELGPDLVRRIIRVVRTTYRFGYSAAELARRRLAAPTSVFPALGDEDSFLRTHPGAGGVPPTVVRLDTDHYSILRDRGIGSLVKALREREAGGLPVPGTPGPAIPKEGGMPHVSIKYFPVPLGEERRAELAAALTTAVRDAFGVDEGVISIALQPVDAADWNEQVYVPEIKNRGDQLLKAPNY